MDVGDQVLSFCSIQRFEKMQSSNISSSTYCLKKDYAISYDHAHAPITLSNYVILGAVQKLLNV